MKLVTGLSVLQIVAIVFLATRIMSLEPVTQAPAPAEDDGTISKAAGILSSPAEPVIIQAYPDEKQLRKIVREELAAQLQLLAPPNADPVAAERPNATTEAERRLQYALVEQELNHYITLGTISDIEMQQLEAEIAKLGKDGQKEMLGRLVRAINTGELDGRL